MGRLLIIVVLVLVVLAVFFAVRAIRARQRAAELKIGWIAQKIELSHGSLIVLRRYGQKYRPEAFISYNEPDYSNRVIEEFAAAEAKAADWNSTDSALNAG